MSSISDYTTSTSFTADGVLFDMDGTLTDSIAAVEAAWTAKAQELGLEPEAVIRATHGRRASDNLMELVPGLRKEHIEREVEKFEKSILAFADTPPRSRQTSFVSVQSARSSVTSLSPVTPRTTSHSTSPLAPLSTIETLNFTSYQLGKTITEGAVEEESPFLEEAEESSDVLDMSVRILPGVRKMIDSLPHNKYAVATSGAKTYCHGCLNRTNIIIPKVCVTADDIRLARGKPFPDPFLLAAADLGIEPTRAVVFEDSPSGIKAGVASGATVIAVCTSHKREQIENLGAHYVVDTMDQVQVEQLEGGELQFTVVY